MSFCNCWQAVKTWWRNLRYAVEPTAYPHLYCGPSPGTEPLHLSVRVAVAAAHVSASGLSVRLRDRRTSFKFSRRVFCVYCSSIKLASYGRNTSGLNRKYRHQSQRVLIIELRWSIMGKTVSLRHELPWPSVESSSDKTPVKDAVRTSSWEYFIQDRFLLRPERSCRCSRTSGLRSMVLYGFTWNNLLCLKGGNRVLSVCGSDSPEGVFAFLSVAFFLHLMYFCYIG